MKRKIPNPNKIPLNHNELNHVNENMKIHVITNQKENI